MCVVGVCTHVCVWVFAHMPANMTTRGVQRVLFSISPLIVCCCSLSLTLKLTFLARLAVSSESSENLSVSLADVMGTSTCIYVYIFMWVL